MRVAVLKEILEGEKRAAAVPATVEKMVGAGMEVLVEAGAGLASGFADAEYLAAGARRCWGTATWWSRSSGPRRRSSTAFPIALCWSRTPCKRAGNPGWPRIG